MPRSPTRKLPSAEEYQGFQRAEVTEAEKRAQLRKILDSTDFDAPGRVRRFLSHIVDEALAGRTEKLKGYSLAIDVFERDPGFDAMNDPVVRIGAGRLRRALERYYLLEGSTDQLLIDVPKGAYEPEFRFRILSSVEPEQAPYPEGESMPRQTSRGSLATRWKVVAAGMLLMACFALASVVTGGWSPTISNVSQDGRKVTLVLNPFTNLSGTPEVERFAAGLGEELLNELVSVPGIVLLGRGISLASPEREERASLGLEGSVTGGQDGRIVVRWRLVHAETGSIESSSRQIVDVGTRQMERQAEAAKAIRVDLVRPLSRLVGVNGPHAWEIDRNAGTLGPTK